MADALSLGPKPLRIGFDVKCCRCGNPQPEHVEPFNNERHAQWWMAGEAEEWNPVLGEAYFHRPPFHRFFQQIAGKVYCVGCIDKLIQETKKC